jgi:hypothetical protein
MKRRDNIAAINELSASEWIITTAQAERVIAPKANEGIEAHQEADIFFIRGAGEIFPYVRTKTLNTLNIEQGNAGGH